jgi:hypothetical protein
MLKFTACFRLLLLLQLGPFLFPALAQSATPTPAAKETPAPPPLVDPLGYSQLWVDKTAVVTPEAVTATIAGVKAQQAKPAQIMVFIHGFDVQRDESTKEFNDLTVRMKSEFAKTNTPVAYVGLQWESAADTSIFDMDAAYFAKIPVSRSVGRGPARELLLGLQKAYPKAHLSLMAHSMGCEVAAAAVVPEMEYPQYLPFVATFAPGTDLRLNLAVLCGSDLDYDIWAKTHMAARDKVVRCQLMWATVAPYLGKGDDVLGLRARIRGIAGGSAFPLMTLAQIDQTISKRRAIFDGEEIPTSHAFEEYYNQDRVGRLVPTMLYISEPSKFPKPPEVAQADQILAAPNDLGSLRPYLDSEFYGSMVYTLWRIERVNCGDARHLTDGTLSTVGKMLKDHPQMIWRAQPKSECVTIKNGDFPTEKMMTRAGAPPSSRP